MVDISDLTVQNPWWVSGKLVNDPKLEEYDSSKFKWDPRIRKKISLETEGVYIIRGARRIGKTTLLRLVIRDVLSKGWKSQNIFFWSCDNVNDRKELHDIISTYLKWAGNEDIKLICIDEVTFVPEWELAYKAIFEEFGLSNKIFLFTGSSSYDLKVSSERLPGRKGKNGRAQILFVPMKFSEYIKLIKPNLYRQLVNAWGISGEFGVLSYPTKELHELLLNPKRRKDLTLLINRMMPLKNQLDNLIDGFILTGGVIKPINELLSSHKIENSTYEMYIEWVLGDISMLNLSQKTAKNLMRSLISNTGNMVGWKRLCDNSGIKEERTAMEYIEALNTIFLINYTEKIDLNKKGPVLRSNRKFYFTNPFFYLAFSNYLKNPASDYFIESKKSLNDPEIKSKLVEGIVYDHLIRLAYNLNPSDLFDPKDIVFYSYADKEIDFILKNGNAVSAFELKYQNKINSEDYKGLQKFNGNKYMISKNELDLENIITIPLSIFLSLV